MAEYGTRPSEAFEWNTGGSNRTAASSALKIAGWAFKVLLPSGIVNWAWNLIGQWTAYLDRDGQGRIFDSLASATRELDIGDVALVNEDTSGADWLEVTESAPMPTEGGVSGIVSRTRPICVAGGFLFASYRVLDPDTLETLHVNTFTFDQVDSDGYTLFVADSSDVTGYAIPDDGEISGSALWTVDHGNSVRCLTHSGELVLFGGVRDSGTGHFGAISHVTGSTPGGATWKVDLGANTYAVNDLASDGDQVWVAADEDSSSGDDLYLYTRAGSLVVAVDSGSGRDAQALALGRTMVFIGLDNGDIVARLKSNLNTDVWTVSGQLSEVLDLAMCGDVLVAAGIGTNTMVALDPDTGIVLGTWDHGLVAGGGSDVDIAAITSDGMAVYAIGDEDDASPGQYVWRHNLIRGPVLARRAQPAASFSPDDFGDRYREAFERSAILTGITKRG